MNKLLVLLLPLLFSLLSVEGRAATSGNVNIERSALLSDAFDSQSLQLSQDADDRDEHLYIGSMLPELLSQVKQIGYLDCDQPSIRSIFDASSIRAPPSIR
jgi:hypothetical protein